MVAMLPCAFPYVARRFATRTMTANADSTTPAHRPDVVRTIPDLRAAVAALRADGRRITLVPTMGAFHEGHLSLMRVGHEAGDAVVVSLFVNPTQFGPTEDLAAYPRDEDRDLEQIGRAHV